MLVDRFFKELECRLEEIKEGETGNIDSAAEICADSLANGGVIHIYDTGHLISNELLGRAGGLAAYTQFTFGISVGSANTFRGAPTPPTDVESERAVIAAALDRSTIKPGDVLIIGSVSGNTIPVVELAFEAKRRKVSVVALTGMAQSGNLEPLHPSGKRLADVADVALDNHTVFGDAMIPVEGLKFPVCPFSGIGAAIVTWALTAAIVEKLIAHGIEPTVYQSVHMPGGFEQLKESQARYAKKGI